MQILFYVAHKVIFQLKIFTDYVFFLFYALFIFLLVLFLTYSRFVPFVVGCEPEISWKYYPVMHKIIP